MTTVFAQKLTKNSSQEPAPGYCTNADALGLRRGGQKLTKRKGKNACEWERTKISRLGGGLLICGIDSPRSCAPRVSKINEKSNQNSSFQGVPTDITQAGPTGQDLKHR